MLEGFVGDGFEMVGGGCAEFGCEVGTGAGAELLGVNAESEAVLRGRR